MTLIQALIYRPHWSLVQVKYHSSFELESRLGNGILQVNAILHNILLCFVLVFDTLRFRIVRGATRKDLCPSRCTTHSKTDNDVLSGKPGLIADLELLAIE